MILGNRDLTRSQIGYARIYILAMSIKPKPHFIETGSTCRDFAIRITGHRNFESFIMLCICSNSFVLGTVWYMQDQDVVEIRENINFVFMAIFTVEAFLKIMAQGCYYFKDSWNVFDFCIVMLTIIILDLHWAGVGENIKMLGTILLTLRTLRIFRLIKKHQKLNEIYNTLLDATPSMASLGLLLMLFIFMFSIIGMSLFALVDIKDTDELTRHVNFQTFGAAFLTLLRCSTGEAWNAIMFDTAKNYSILH